MHTPSNEGLGRLPWVLSGFALAIVVVLFAVSHRPERASNADTVRLTTRKSLPAWKPGPNWASAVPPDRRPGEAISIPIYPPWTKQQAEALFGVSPFEMVDEYCGKLYKPNIKFTQGLDEYPGGKIEFVVNSRSMREDTDPLVTKPLLRVLVAGDSHTDGVCRNSESFPNLTEFDLRLQAKSESAGRGETFDPQSIEVLNAGKGSHSFFNYLGVLERNLDLTPDVFVVAVYGGNDFFEVMPSWHFYFDQGRRPPISEDYDAEVMAAVEVKQAGLSQALASVKYFSVFPGEEQIAVRASVEVSEQIQALCRERGIRLIVIYLPPRLDVEPNNPDLKLRRLLGALKLEYSALASTPRMADQLLAKLADMGIETIDMRPEFQQAEEPLYWSADWHINLAGHQLVARALVKALSARH